MCGAFQNMQRFFKKTCNMHFWMSQAISWTKKNWWNFFFDFHRGDPYVFPQISSKISRWFLKEFLKKNPKGPPFENRKKISSIFFVQDIAWDIQKCILEVFLKNLYILWNAPHIRLGTFWGHKPFCLFVDLFTKMQVNFTEKK